jgi:hypothetical protein
MGIGHGAGIEAPPVAARIIASGALEYEMTDRDAWHYVRPIDGVAFTVMLSGPPWQRNSPSAGKVLEPLAPSRVTELLEVYERLYQCDRIDRA